MQAEDEDGNTPLMLTILRRDLETAKCILSHKQGLLSVGKKNLQGFSKTIFELERVFFSFVGVGDPPLWAAMECAARYGNEGFEMLSLITDSLPRALGCDDETWIDPEFQVT